MSKSPLQGARPLWIASYPRSGNTFLRIILEQAFHLPSYSLYLQEGDSHSDPSAEALESAPRLPQQWRRLLTNDGSGPFVPIKTHGPPTDEAHAIFIARDGRSALHSYFHYHKKFAFEQPSLTEVIAGACQFGSWSEHYWAWRPKHRPNTLVLMYDELANKPGELISRLAEFLGLEPAAASLPDFAELQGRWPAFFRRGQNKDYLLEWTSSQMALFNELHAPAMEDLGFRIAETQDSASGVAAELAQSAARLHGLYLQQLSNVGLSIAEHQRDVERLSKLTEQLSAPLEQILKPMLKTGWVRAGMRLGVLPKVSADQLPASPLSSKGIVAGDKPAAPLRSSDENIQSSLSNLPTNQPSVPNGEVSAPG